MGAEIFQSPSPLPITQAVRPPALAVSGTGAALNATPIASTDVSSHSTIYLQVKGTWAGTLLFEGSNDNSTWVAVALTKTGTGNSPVTSTTSVGIYWGPLNARYFRARVSVYTSGTFEAEAVFTPTGGGGGSSGGGGATDTTLVGSQIIVPTDLQAILRLTADSTTTPLGIGETYTGITIDTSELPFLQAFVFADQGGTLKIQESHDTGTTWRDSASFTVTANTLKTVYYTAVTDRCRWIYANGAVAQTVFNFKTRKGAA